MDIRHLNLMQEDEADTNDELNPVLRKYAIIALIVFNLLAWAIMIAIIGVGVVWESGLTS